MSQQSQSQSSSTSAESRQEEAAAASVTKRENNWVDAEIRVKYRSIDELYEVNGLRHHGARRVRFLLKTVRLYTNLKRFSNNGLNQIVIFHASVNPAYVSDS